MFQCGWFVFRVFLRSEILELILKFHPSIFWHLLDKFQVISIAGNMVKQLIQLMYPRITSRRHSSVKNCQHSLHQYLLVFVINLMLYTFGLCWLTLVLIIFFSVPETPNITAAYALLDTSRQHQPLAILCVEWTVRLVFVFCLNTK